MACCPRTEASCHLWTMFRLCLCLKDETVVRQASSGANSPHFPLSSSSCSHRHIPPTRNSLQDGAVKCSFLKAPAKNKGQVTWEIQRLRMEAYILVSGKKWYTPRSKIKPQRSRSGSKGDLAGAVKGQAQTLWDLHGVIPSITEGKVFIHVPLANPHSNLQEHLTTTPFARWGDWEMNWFAHDRTATKRQSPVKTQV